MFFEYFEDVRKRSPEARKAYAISFASITTGVIVFVWLITLFFGGGWKLLNLNKDNGGLNKDKQLMPVKDSAKMFNSSNMFLKDGIEDIKISSKNNSSYNGTETKQDASFVGAVATSTVSSTASNTIR